MAFGVSQIEESRADTGNRWARTQLLGFVATVAWLLIVSGVFFALSFAQPGPLGADSLITAALLLTLPVAMIWLYVLLIRQSQLTEMALFHQIADLERYQILPNSAETHMQALTEAFRTEAREFNQQAERALDTFTELTTNFEDQARRMSTLATSVNK